eukprot:SAG31_NODE_1042_length_10187_cov_54.452121_6_plen_109_part_00
MLLLLRFAAAMSSHPELKAAFPNLQTNFLQCAHLLTSAVKENIQKCTAADVPELLTWLAESFTTEPSNFDAQHAVAPSPALGQAVLSLLATLVATHPDVLRLEAGRLL